MKNIVILLFLIDIKTGLNKSKPQNQDNDDSGTTPEPEMKFPEAIPFDSFEELMKSITSNSKLYLQNNFLPENKEIFGDSEELSNNDLLYPKTMKYSASREFLNSQPKNNKQQFFKKSLGKPNSNRNKRLSSVKNKHQQKNKAKRIRDNFKVKNRPNKKNILQQKNFRTFFADNRVNGLKFKENENSGATFLNTQYQNDFNRNLLDTKGRHVNKALDYKKRFKGPKARKVNRKGFDGKREIKIKENEHKKLPDHESGITFFDDLPQGDDPKLFSDLDESEGVNNKSVDLKISNGRSDDVRLETKVQKDVDGKPQDDDLKVVGEKHQDVLNLIKPTKFQAPYENHNSLEPPKRIFLTFKISRSKY